MRLEKLRLAGIVPYADNLGENMDSPCCGEVFEA